MFSALNCINKVVAGAQDNYAHMEYTALDLSPYYLYEARNNMQQWHRLRQPQLNMGGLDGSGAHFLQAAAESIPQPDASHDVVSAMAGIRDKFWYTHAMARRQ